MMNIGITGHQQLEDPKWVKQEIDEIIEKLEAPLTGISSLAIGADQLFAESIISHKGELYIILPFSEYENSFVVGNDRNNYNNLLSKATKTLTLEKKETNEHSYYEAGKKVVDESELLIAVWNGKPAKGLGGTADVVKYALTKHKRVIHINPVSKTITNL